MGIIYLFNPAPQRIEAVRGAVAHHSSSSSISLMGISSTQRRTAFASSKVKKTRSGGFVPTRRIFATRICGSSRAIGNCSAPKEIAHVTPLAISSHRATESRKTLACFKNSGPSMISLYIYHSPRRTRPYQLYFPASSLARRWSSGVAGTSLRNAAS